MRYFFPSRSRTRVEREFCGNDTPRDFARLSVWFADAEEAASVCAPAVVTKTSRASEKSNCIERIVFG